MSLKVLLAFEVKLFYKEFGMYFSENFVLQHCIIQDYFIINFYTFKLTKVFIKMDIV